MAESVTAGANEKTWHLGFLTPPVVHLISGGIAGCVAKSAIAPFDRVKILSQVCPKSPYFHFLQQFLRGTQ